MQTTIGYIVNKKYYNTLLTNFKEGLSQLMIHYAHWHFALDIYWKKLQEKDEWLCIYPYLIKQRASYSSIENTFSNYDQYYMKPLNIVN
jgi:glycosyl transferase family 25